MAWLNVNPEGGLAGWGAPPQLHGGDVASLANAIALMRQKQTENTGKSFTDAIKQYQGHREDDAYLKQLQEAGLIGSGEGLSAEGGTSLAKLIETQKLRALQEQLYGAHSAEYNAQAAKYNAMAAMAGEPKGLTAYQQLQENRRNQNAQAYDQLVNDETSAYTTIKQLQQAHPDWKKGPVAPSGGIFGRQTPDDVWNQYLADKALWEKAKDTLMKSELKRGHPNMSVPGDANDEADLPSGGSAAPQSAPAAPQQPAQQQITPPTSSSTPVAPQQSAATQKTTQLAPGYGAAIAASRDQATADQPYYRAPDGSIRVRQF